MKITKKSKKTIAEATENVKEVVESAKEVIDDPVEDADEEEVINNESIECACSNIQSAIDNLGNIAKTNVMARDAIANLSVVLLELK